jgi:hypothetical protein
MRNSTVLVGLCACTALNAFEITPLKVVMLLVHSSSIQLQSVLILGILFHISYICWVMHYIWARDNVVGWGTMLQAGRSGVRFAMSLLNYSIYLIHPAALWSWSRLSLWQKLVSGIFLGGKGRPARKTDNLTAIHEPTIYKICEPRRPTTQWAPTTCYKESFTFPFYVLNKYLSSFLH